MSLTKRSLCLLTLQPVLALLSRLPQHDHGPSLQYLRRNKVGAFKHTDTHCAYRLPACHEHAASWLSASRYTALHRQHVRFCSAGSTDVFFVSWWRCMSSSRVRRVP
jgi:hypothetical protein